MTHGLGSFAVLLVVLSCSALAQIDDLDGFGLEDPSPSDRPADVVQEESGKRAGPLKDATYELLWLIESDDENRRTYEGPARKGLTEAGFGRLVYAGATQAGVTIGQQVIATGVSRYGPLTTRISLLNTTASDHLQIKVSLQTNAKTAVALDTTVRVPLGRWFLLGSAETRAGLPKHASDGRRSVLIMKLSEGVKTLD